MHSLWTLSSVWKYIYDHGLPYTLQYRGKWDELSLRLYDAYICTRNSQWVFDGSMYSDHRTLYTYIFWKRAPCVLSDARSEKFISIHWRNGWKNETRLARVYTRGWLKFFYICKPFINMYNKRFHLRFNFGNVLCTNIVIPYILKYLSIVILFSFHILLNQLFAGLCFSVFPRFEIILISCVMYMCTDDGYYDGINCISA